MLESIANFLGNIAAYVAAVLGLVVLFFLWVAFREWRSSRRAVFGIERDIATSEMMGAIARAGAVVVVGLVILGLGQIGQQVESSDDAEGQTAQPSVPTVSLIRTPTAELGEPALTVFPTDTSQPGATGVPSLPEEPTQPPAAEPTPQTATVTAFGGVWLRDAPNGGTIGVLPQGSVVEFLEGREFAGSFEWQKVRVLSTPAGGEALVDREGWVAAQFLESAP